MKSQQPAKKVVELSSRVTEHGGDMIFQRSGNTVCCMVYTSSFDDESAFKGFAKPFDHDPFNEWIGKCVAACKAMGEPIPASSHTKTPNRMLRDGHNTRIYHPHPQLCRVPAS